MGRKTKKISEQVIIFCVILFVFLLGGLIGVFITLKFLIFDEVEQGEIIYEEADSEKVAEILQASQAIQYNDIVENNINTVQENEVEDRSGSQYVASSRGKKYYPIDCSAADSLSENNKVYFNSQEEAENAGYSKSSSCEF